MSIDIGRFRIKEKVYFQYYHMKNRNNEVIGKVIRKFNPNIGKETHNCISELVLWHNYSFVKITKVTSIIFQPIYPQYIYNKQN